MGQGEERNTVEGSVTIAAGLWAADPHEFGPGKIHLVDAENTERTLCGKWLKAVPGKLTNTGRGTCRICLNAVENRTHSRLMEEDRQRDRERSERERAAQSREWWTWYNQYLKSPAWRERAAMVKRRSGGMCEGCGARAAVQVHHETYAHVGNEFLWELRAICNVCHERIHGEKQ
jgi:hypothetical protein